MDDGINELLLNTLLELNTELELWIPKLLLDELENTELLLNTLDEENTELLLNTLLEEKTELLLNTLDEELNTELLLNMLRLEDIVYPGMSATVAGISHS